MSRPRALARAVAGHGLDDSGRRYPARAVSDREWDELLAMARAHRLTGLLVQALEDGALPTTESQIDRALAVQEDAMVGCVALEQRLLELHRAAGAIEVPIWALKGVATAHLWYDDPAQRAFGDLDVLVRPSDVARVRELVEAFGGDRRFPEPVRGFDRSFGKGMCLVLPDGLEIDLHRTLAPGYYGLRVDPEELTGSTRTYTIAGEVVPTLTPDRQLVHACYHAVLGSAQPPLISLRDVAQIVLADESVGGDAVALASRWRGEAVVARAVAVAWDTLHPGFDPPLVQWARGHVAGARDRRRLRRYQGSRRSGAAQALEGLAAVPGVAARARYARAVLVPSRRAAGRTHRERWRRGLRSLRPQH